MDRRQVVRVQAVGEITLAVISMAVVVYAGLLFYREHQRSGSE